jgi:transcriptional regulator with XRE-family HTH domain
MKGWSRKLAAEKLGCSRAAVEQFENTRCNLSPQRVQKILSAYGYSEEEFVQIRRDSTCRLAELCEQGRKDRSLSRKPRRNVCQKITKEVRALRILRKRRGISQCEASRLCGYIPRRFSHLEAGRIELKRPRLEHILQRLGYTWNEFENLVQAPILRDEVIEAAIQDLYRLNDQALTSAANIIKALLK